MDFRKKLGNSLKIAIALSGLVATFITVVQLMYFLSDPHYSKKTTSTDGDVYLSTSWGLLINGLLLATFILQHSVMAAPRIKYWIADYNLQDVYRSFYIISTAVALQTLMKYWYQVEFIFWSVNLDYSPLWWLYTFLHVTAWTIIYVGNICKDVNELLGLKQVYYSIINLPDPVRQKSRQLQRLNEHMRHPSFLAFVIIFWVTPVMSLDRLFLALITTGYMWFAWNTDDLDYVYQHDHFVRKFHELERLH